MTRVGFVEPHEVSKDDEGAAYLRKHWPDVSQVEWLWPLVREFAPLPDDVIVGERAAVSVARSLAGMGHWTAKQPAAALACFISGQWRVDPSTKPRLVELVRAAKSHGLQFADSVGDLPATNVVVGSRNEILRLLLALDALDVSEAIHWDRVLEKADMLGAWPKSHRFVPWPVDSFEFWMDVSQAEVLQAAGKQLDEIEDVAFPRFARGLMYSIGLWRCEYRFDEPGALQAVTGHPTDFAVVGAAFQRAIEVMLGKWIDRALATPAMLKEPLLCEALLRLWWMAFDQREEETTQNVIDALVEPAKRELGRMRKQVAAATAETIDDVAQQVEDHAEAASRFLFRCVSLWDGMKPLILLIRALPVPAFAFDLDWRYANSEPPRSNAVARLAGLLMWGFQANIRHEEDQALNLEALREVFGRFCLERLKTVRRSDRSVEPSADWRWAYIRAFRVLAVNPGGKGHRILFHVRESDADEDVRAAAAKAYQATRDGKAPQRGSARRLIMEALWWLRQAQLLSLGFPVDDQGAALTRDREIRFTTEKKQNF